MVIRKKFLDVQYPKLLKFINAVSFLHIFLLWLALNLIFSFFYFFISLWPGHGLLFINGSSSFDFVGFLNALYFSFITSTGVGYGDIVPMGTSKFLTVVEVIMELVLYGILVSKLVGLKQEIMLKEIYTITFEENINRLRASMFLLRSDMSRFIDKIESKTLKKRELSDLSLQFYNFEKSMKDIARVICSRDKHGFLQKLDDFKLELIIDSLHRTFSRLIDFIEALDKHKISYKKTIINESVNSILNDLDKILSEKRLEKDTRIADRVEELRKIEKHLKKIDFKIEK